MMEEAMREYLQDYVKRLAQRYVTEKNIHEKMIAFNETVKELFMSLTNDHSIEEISNKTGYTIDYIKRIIDSKRPLPLITFIRIALALGYQVDINLRREGL